MNLFKSKFPVRDSTTIIDLGGGPPNWKYVNEKPSILIINLSIPEGWQREGANFKFEAGDATQLKYADKSFDIAYSNSVIEHLFTWEKQQKFASEALRVGKSVFVQTPAREFFLEPHYLTPFIHWLPVGLQSKLLRNFTVWGILSRPSKEKVERTLSEIRLLSYNEIRLLFPGCEIIKEKFLFLTKSYIVVKVS